MGWLEITIETASSGIEELAAGLTAGGFSDLLTADGIGVVYASKILKDQ